MRQIRFLASVRLCLRWSLTLTTAPPSHSVQSAVTAW